MHFCSVIPIKVITFSSYGSESQAAKSRSQQSARHAQVQLKDPSTPSEKGNLNIVEFRMVAKSQQSMIRWRITDSMDFIIGQECLKALNWFEHVKDALVVAWSLYKASGRES